MSNELFIIVFTATLLISVVAIALIAEHKARQ